MTLVETLVVIGIITLLAVLLLPAFKMVNTSSNNARCLANLRASGAMVQAMITDSGNRLVTRAGGNTLAGYYFWTDRLWREGYLPKEWKAGTHPGKKATDMLRCPSAPSANPGGDTWYWFTYGMNMYDPRATQDLRGPNKDARIFELHVSRVEKPSTYVLLADSINAAGTSQHTRLGSKPSFTEGIELRHRGRANAYFLDGHVRGLDRSEAQSLGVPNIYDEFKRN